MAQVYSRLVPNWWDDAELWVAQLPFALQFTVVMAVLLPLCVVVAWLIDRAVDWGVHAIRSRSRVEHPLGARAESDS